MLFNARGRLKFCSHADIQNNDCRNSINTSSGGIGKKAPPLRMFVPYIPDQLRSEVNAFIEILPESSIFAA